MGSDGKKKRARTRNRDALASNGESTFDERLQTSCSEHSGQGPTRKRQEALPCSGGHDEMVVLQGDHLRIAAGFSECVEGSRGGCIEDAVAGEQGCSGRGEIVKCSASFGVFSFLRELAGGLDTAAPDLSSG